MTSAQSGKRGRDNEKRINEPRASARSEIGGEATGEVSPVRVLIADDHPLMLGGLREAVLAAAPDAEIAVAHDFESMVAALDASPDTDLVLLDLTMPGVRGFSGLLFLRSERPSTPVIVVSGNEERAVIRHCLEFGAAGFIPKTNSLETMRAAIVQVLAGGRWTPPDFDLNAAPTANRAQWRGGSRRLPRSRSGC